MDSEIVFNFRQKYSMSQRQLAILLGVTTQAIVLWERSARSVPVTTKRVLKLLDTYPHLIAEFDKE